jgi:hypothetical protein
MLFMALSTSSTLLPLVRVMPYLSSRLSTSCGNGPPLPAQITNTYLGPERSLSAPMIFWIGAVKSVAVVGVYSSWTTWAPAFSTAAL